MADLKIWFLDVGHGDCAYVELPNGARMMIDCGCGEDRWPSRFLKHYGITKSKSSVVIPNDQRKFGLDNLVISHPHGDHFADIEAIHDEIGFYLLTGGYGALIDKIPPEKMDWRKRQENASKKFIEVVKHYNGQYEEQKDRVVAANPPCKVKKKRFIQYEADVDLNELSWFVSFEMGARKVLFTGDMTAGGVRKILASPSADEFKEFVKGTTILKVPHHGRENGCSDEMFDAFGGKPLLCIVSDQVLNEENEGTSNVAWYNERTQGVLFTQGGEEQQERKVLTTRNDGDIYLKISDNGDVHVTVQALRDARTQILGVGQRVVALP